MKTLETVNQILARYYQIPVSRVDDITVIHELVNLRRKFKKGNLDDMQQALYNELKAKGML